MLQMNYMISYFSKISIFLITSLWFLGLSFADDSESWRTVKEVISTKLGDYSIEIHYQNRDKAFTDRVIKILKKDSPKILEYFDYVPQETIQFIVEESSLANGSATVFPTNIIRLYNVPPTNDQYLLSNENWIQGLVLHELVHIIHMDQTRGFLKGLRTIFGAVGKLGGIVPRWFTEGVGTWAESEFTVGGRLRNDVLSMELKYLILRDDFCSTIDCLDEPGEYPHGRNSYWTGAYFLQSLEKEKPKTISCLIKANSDSIPFFLNSAFNECVGMSASKAFTRFRNKWRKEILAEVSITKRKNLFKGFKRESFEPFESINWQKGVQIKDGWIFFHSDNKKIPKVVSYNLYSKKLKYSRFDEIIYRYGEDSFSNKLLTLSTIERSGNSFNTYWKLWNIKKNKVLNLKTKKNVEHLFLLENGGRLFADFDKNKWSLYKQEVKTDSKPIFNFPEMMNLTLLKTFSLKGKTKLLIRSQSNSFKNNLDELYIYDPLKNVLSLVFESNEPLTFIGQCNTDFIFKNSLRGNVFGLSVSNDSVQRLKLPNNLWKNVASYRSDGKNHLVLSDKDPSHFYWKQGTCKNALGYKSKELIKRKKSNTVLLTEQKEKFDYEDESYPSLRHFLPHYWVIGYGGTQSTTAWSAATEFSDPREKHKLAVSARYYPKLSDNGETISYTYNMDPIIIGGIYDKTYSFSNISNTANSYEQAGAIVSWPIYIRKWSYIPAASFINENVNDIVSNRKVEKSRFSQIIATQKTFYDDFIQGYQLKVDFLNQKTKGFASFWGVELLEKIQLKLAEKLEVQLRASYGKLKKKGFTSGVLYGGSAGYLGGESTHEFYGVFYNDIFGNEILTARVQLDYLFREVYHGSGLFPIYIKEFRWLLGFDYIKADRIILENKVLRNEGLMSAHAGARFKTTLAYLAPINVDLLYVKLLGSHADSQDDESSFMFLLSSSLF